MSIFYWLLAAGLVSLLITVPVSAVFLEDSWIWVVFPMVLALMLILHFIPTAGKALARAGSKKDLYSELVRNKPGRQG